MVPPEGDWVPFGNLRAQPGDAGCQPSNQFNAIRIYEQSRAGEKGGEPEGHDNFRRRWYLQADTVSILILQKDALKSGGAGGGEE